VHKVLDIIIPSTTNVPPMVRQLTQSEFLNVLERSNDANVLEMAHRFRALLEDTMDSWDEAYDQGRDAGLMDASEYDSHYDDDVRKEIVADMKDKITKELQQEAMKDNFQKTVGYFRDKLNTMDCLHKGLMTSMQEDHCEEMRENLSQCEQLNRIARKEANELKVDAQILRDEADDHRLRAEKIKATMRVTKRKMIRRKRKKVVMRYE